MHAFQDASRVRIRTANFTHVNGDQIINHHYGTASEDEKEHTIYEEFDYIKLGNIYSITDVHREDCVQWIKHDWGLEGTRLQAERKISTAEIVGKRGRFTVFSYRGDRATQVWEEDFRKYSQTRDTLKMQLFGINKSHIPMLIFFNELVPLGSSWDLIHPLGQAYLNVLAKGWGCKEQNVWIDSKYGKLIHGADGPKCPGNFISLLSPDETPSIDTSIDFLQEDVVFRYLSRLPLDKEFDKKVLITLTWQLPTVLNLTDIKTNVSIVISALTNCTIAVGRLLWRSDRTRCLDSRVMMANGKIRFTLIKDSEYLYLKLISRPSEDEAAWLSQASSVFHKHGIPLDGDLSEYKLIVTDVHLSGQVDESKASRQLRQNLPKIYLFMLSSSYAHFWSHDATGRTHIPTKTCKHLGLPTKLHVEVYPSRQYFWPTKMYQDVHNWQVHRKFDATTANFASYLGYFTYKVALSKSSRFEELGKDNEDFALDQFFYNAEPHPGDVATSGSRHAPYNSRDSKKQPAVTRARFGRGTATGITNRKTSSVTTRPTSSRIRPPASQAGLPKGGTNISSPKHGTGQEVDCNKEPSKLTCVPAKSSTDSGPRSKGPQSKDSNGSHKVQDPPTTSTRGRLSAGTQQRLIWR